MSESPILPPRNKAGKRISIILAVVVHLLLAGFLFYGVRWQTKATDVVEVELVRATPEPVAAPVAVSPAPTVEPPPPKPEPKPEPVKPPPKPDIALKEKEKPKPPPKVAPPPRVDPVQNQINRELEQLTQRKNLDIAQREVTQKEAERANAVRNKAITDYVNSIAARIRRNIVVPPEVKGNPEAVFEVTQLPSGEIVTVRLKRSSGHGALDAAIERAILKSNPLPKPQQADIFRRDLELRLRPLDD